jgi:GR25 family glycosyltransferase involved in LPS biosynthesis
VIVINLPQFPYRGISAPYLWMFYKFLSSTKGDMHFLIHQDYLLSPEKWMGLDRWELHASSQRQLGYEIPSPRVLEKIPCSLMPDELFGRFLSQAEGNPLMAFEKVLSEVMPDLSAYYDSELEDLSKGENIEAILTPINCPTLKEVARSRGIPIIHFELGPLRGPGYIDLAYFDFQGLNEQSEFLQRYGKFSREPGARETADLSSVRKLYLKSDWWLGDPSARATKFDVGVSLQIEDDTNLISSSNGFTNQALIAYSKLKFLGKRIGYKAHPGSFFDIKPEKGGVEYSSGTDFLFDCDEILTINSSMGFEALLWGKPAHLVGKSAYAYIATLQDKNEQERALCYYLKNYLVPFQLIFDCEYINFRLKMPTEIEIQNKHLNELLRLRMEELSKLNQAVNEHEGQIVILNQTVSERDSQIASLSQAVNEHEGQIVILNQTVSERDSQIASLSQAVTERNMYINALTGSKSWRITLPLRFIARMMRRGFLITVESVLKNRNLQNIQVWVRYIKKALRYVVRGDLKGLYARINFHRREVMVESTSQFESKNGDIFWGIITPGHTLFVAYLISERLNHHGGNAEIMTSLPENFSHDLYIVLCPQIFDRLPPGEKRIIFQLEQSVSSRWFTDEYFKILENSLAVLEYSLTNIAFLATKGVAYPHIHYLPIGASDTYGSQIIAGEKKYDVLFYGDCLSSPRRRRMLEAAKQHFNVHIVNELFGLDMIKTLKEARVVLNIHYYENALLEMPRIQESLSLGIPVVSESAQDQSDYPEFEGAVIFFENDSVDGMITAIQKALKTEAHEIDLSIKSSQTRFGFMVDRFLVAMGFVDAAVVRNIAPPLPFEADTFGLSLPETINRRKIFQEMRPSDCVIFDGIRRRPGWVGCGLSYAVLAKHALENRLESITVMEDDVILPPNYGNALIEIKNYLSRKNVSWDIFSGLIAHLHPDTEVLAVEEFEGRTFVTINKMTSTVFNIYSKGAMKMFCDWDHNNHDADTNTIDRFLESQRNIRVVTTLPYFVGHREEVYSTLWGFQNSIYIDLITKSEALLRRKVDEFLAKYSCGVHSV